MIKWHFSCWREAVAVCLLQQGETRSEVNNGESAAAFNDPWAVWFQTIVSATLPQAPVVGAKS